MGDAVPDGWHGAHNEVLLQARAAVFDVAGLPVGAVHQPDFVPGETSLPAEQPLLPQEPERL